MGFLLAVVGASLLLLSLAGIALGSFMALDRRTRKPGFYFVLWWVPALAAAGGILMRDPATFIVGALCFVVAGAVFALERGGPRRSARSKTTNSRDTRKRPPPEEMQSWSERARRWLSDRTQAHS